jgi:hypothetical protein
MPDSYFQLSTKNQASAIAAASDASGRAPHLLEKDIWVVWALSALFQSQLGANLVFKGGTALSEAHKVITRFSEDVDLTYDIRALALNWFVALPAVSTRFRPVAARRRNGPTKSARNSFQLGFATMLTQSSKPGWKG